jgi:hypothetical protein
MSRERVSLADLDDTEDLHRMDNRAKVRRFTNAIRRGASLPPVFAIRMDGELTLIQGSEQAAAAERLGVDGLDAIIFDALSAAECDEVGAVGFDLAECGCDVWSGLQLMGWRAQACAAA